jgi:hypothetical protein
MQNPFIFNEKGAEAPLYSLTIVSALIA